MNRSVGGARKRKLVRHVRPRQRPVVSAHGIVLQDGCILLVKRSHPPGRGRWSVPGGRVELGESARETVRRELREECGITVEVGMPVDVVDNVVLAASEGSIEAHFVVIFFQATLLSGVPRAGSDAAEIRWASGRELSSLEMHPQARRVLWRILAEALGEGGNA
jgi:8-oxo-dGTP diphosphatase